MIDVRPGDVWKDIDSRPRLERSVEIVSIIGEYAACWQSIAGKPGKSRAFVQLSFFGPRGSYRLVSRGHRRDVVRGQQQAEASHHALEHVPDVHGTGRGI